MQTWFFVNDNIESEYVLRGENACHAKKSLRMKPGEEIILCDKESYCYKTVITEILGDELLLKVIDKFKCQNEPDLKVTLYQAVTKGDKMDSVVQKAVELGVYEITPILTKRCISRPDKKSAESKILRWQKISLQAAMQSRRGIIPKVNNIITLEEAVKKTANDDFSVVFYEKGGESLHNIIESGSKKGSIFVGCEGGFDEAEIAYLNDNNVKNATLGPRILRTETAPLTALSILMYITNNI